MEKERLQFLCRTDAKNLRRCDAARMDFVSVPVCTVTICIICMCITCTSTIHAYITIYAKFCELTCRV